MSKYRLGEKSKNDNRVDYFFFKFNKWVGWTKFICVGERTGKLNIFLKINKWVGLDNSGLDGKLSEN